MLTSAKFWSVICTPSKYHNLKLRRTKTTSWTLVAENGENGDGKMLFMVLGIANGVCILVQMDKKVDGIACRIYSMILINIYDQRWEF